MGKAVPKAASFLGITVRAITWVTLTLSVFVLPSCNHRTQKTPVQQSHTREFPICRVPNVITDVSERAEYLSEHFWDGFTDTSKVFYSDTNIINGVPKAVLEQQMSTYSLLVSSIPQDKARKAVVEVFDKMTVFAQRDTSSALFDTMVALFGKYLYDPNSPLRNEDIYGAVAEYLSTSPLVDEDKKPSYAFDASMCSLNRTGTPAADFAFTDLQGRVRRLYGVKSELTLLFFSNPGCPACKEIGERLSKDAAAAALIAEGKLKVVNVYIDLERDKWRESAADYPKEWISGYDHKYIIRTDLIYNVRAIPSLYLLDSNKNVILKDVPEDRLFSILGAIANGTLLH